ncbi:MAG: MBL fold metallo-hydrolase, partial [Actinomycetota bacterium]
MQHSRREPAEGVFRLVLPLPFPGLHRVNAYLLADDAGATLVDCGIHDPAPERDHGWADLADALAACDVTPGDVARLVVTHPHIDHYGMAGTVLARTGCEFWMHGLAQPELEMYRDPEASARRLHAMLADHGVSEEELDELTAFEDWRPFVSEVVDASKWLRGGETFSAGGRTWGIVHTPGHSAGHICLWSEQGRLLISGDHLLPTITPHIDFRRGDEDPLGEFLESLEKIEELAPELVLPGHGRPFEDGAARARVIIRHHDRRLGSILQVIRKEPRTASEITDEIFGTTLLHFQRRLALGEALAHLAHLR